MHFLSCLEFAKDKEYCIYLKFLEIFALVKEFFSGFILILLNFWSGRKNHVGKKVPTWCSDFAFHVGNHVSICWMLMWVRKTAQLHWPHLGRVKRPPDFWFSKLHAKCYMLFFWLTPWHFFDTFSSLKTLSFYTCPP